MNNRFPAACRLKNRKDITAVFAHRDLFRGKRLIFYRKPNSPNLDTESVSRFCFTVSKKCGNAVQRNRIKRVLREIVRINRYRVVSGYDYVIRVDESGLGEEPINQEFFFDDFRAYFQWD